MFPSQEFLSRPAWDQIRECAVILVVALLYWPAVQCRSIVAFILISVTFIQHITSSLMSWEMLNLSPLAVKLGALLLGLVGFLHQSVAISFAGTYSFLSKYQYYPQGTGSQRELAKLLVSILVWAVIFWIRSRCNTCLQRQHVHLDGWSWLYQRRWLTCHFGCFALFKKWFGLKSFRNRASDYEMVSMHHDHSTPGPLIIIPMDPKDA